MASTGGLVQRGKTTLLASWPREAWPPGAPAWVAVERDESGATRFWSMVMDALRDSGAIESGDPRATLVPPPSGGGGSSPSTWSRASGGSRDPSCS